MAKAKMSDLNVAGKRVLCRVDFNVSTDKKTGEIIINKDTQFSEDIMKKLKKTEIKKIRFLKYEGVGESSAIKGDFSNDYGITAGFWVGFPASKSVGVGLDVRFDYGLNDVKAGGNPLTPLKTRALISMLSLQYSF